MENTPVGTMLRISKPYTFPEHDAAATYFPDGITPAHVLILCSFHYDDPWKYKIDRHKKAFVMVVGTFPHPASPFVHWRNPVFAVPQEYFA